MCIRSLPNRVIQQTVYDCPRGIWVSHTQRKPNERPMSEYNFRHKVVTDLCHKYEPEYYEYAVTLKPKFSTWDWWRMSPEDRIEFLKNLWTQIQTQLNSILVNHWRRPSKEPLLVSGTFLMETKTKYRKDTVPHIHGLICLHRTLIPKWVDLLDQPDPNNDVFHMPTLTRGLIDIHDVVIKRPFDVPGWWKYSTKELEKTGELSGFDFSGVPLNALSAADFPH